MQDWIAVVRYERAIKISAEKFNRHGRSYIDSIRSRSKSKTKRKRKMKSAYELAMERLQKNAPTISLTSEQKQQIAEIDSTFKARTAEKELFLKDAIRKAQEAGKFDEVESLQEQLTSEIRRLQEDCEAKKEKLRASFAH
jgi:predicted nucleic acid-binding protein